MAGELTSLSSSKRNVEGRFVRTHSGRVVVTRSDSQNVSDIVMAHSALAGSQGINRTDVADGGLYRYDTSTVPPTLSLYGATDVVTYSRAQRVASISQAFTQLGGSGKVYVVGYDSGATITAQNFVDEKK